MKRLLCLALVLLVSGPVLADMTPDSVSNTGVVQKEQVIVTYDVYKHMENSSNIFLGIGGLTLGIGTSIAATSNGNPVALGAGMQVAIWGAVETALYIYDKNFGEKEKDPEKARLKYAEMSGWHAVFDLAVLTAGAAMVLWGNQDIKGHGAGLMIQGGILALYDGINFFIASNPDDVRDIGAGIRYELKFAGNNTGH